MRIFNKDGKVNFVDATNTLVGYDLTQDCCEHAGWYIRTERGTDTNEEHTWYTRLGRYPGKTDYLAFHLESLEPYVFDREFFETADADDGDTHDSLVRFRLTAPGLPDLYLHLFNAHNGYYAHQFTVEHSGQVVRHDSI